MWDRRARASQRKAIHSTPIVDDSALNVKSATCVIGVRARQRKAIHSGLILIEGSGRKSRQAWIMVVRARHRARQSICEFGFLGPASPWCRILDDGKNTRIFAGLANKACHGVANFVDTSSGSMGKYSSRCSRPPPLLLVHALRTCVMRPARLGAPAD